MFLMKEKEAAATLSLECFAIAIFFQGLGDFFNANGLLLMEKKNDIAKLFWGHDEKDKRKIWTLLFASLSLLLIVWKIYPQQNALAFLPVNDQTCAKTFKDLIYLDKKLQCNEKDSQPSPALNTSSTIAEQCASKFNQWEHELHKIREEVHSIGAPATSRGVDDTPRAFAAIEEQMKKLEFVIND
uniref:Uncharacterized protein n=1 Tax=Panagrolaimus sp. ES5 TaxID=591445 RepID=A0AC34FD41_9BILA